MSQIFNYMLSAVRDYLDREIDVDYFRQAFAGGYYSARNSRRERQANQLANALIGYIAEFSGGFRSEDSLRRELENGIRPFAAGVVILIAAQSPMVQPEHVGPKNYFRKWHMMPLAANENTVDPVLALVGSSNSTVHRISPRRETGNAFGSALVNYPASGAVL